MISLFGHRGISQPLMVAVMYVLAVYCGLLLRSLLTAQLGQLEAPNCVHKQGTHSELLLGFMVFTSNCPQFSLIFLVSLATLNCSGSSERHIRYRQHSLSEALACRPFCNQVVWDIFRLLVSPFWRILNYFLAFWFIHFA